jgi:hypothetical protein
MTQGIPEAVFWCLAAGLFAVTALLVRQRGITTIVRERNAELTDGLRARDEEVRQLASVRLPRPRPDDRSTRGQPGPSGLERRPARLPGAGLGQADLGRGRREAPRPPSRCRAGRARRGTDPAPGPVPPRTCRPARTFSACRRLRGPKGVPCLPRRRSRRQRQLRRLHRQRRLQRPRARNACGLRCGPGGRGGRGSDRRRLIQERRTGRAR